MNAYYNASETVKIEISEVNLDTVTIDGKATTQREFSAAELEDGLHTVVVTEIVRRKRLSLILYFRIFLLIHIIVRGKLLFFRLRK